MRHRKKWCATPVRREPAPQNDWPTTWTGRLALVGASLAGATVIVGLIYGLIVVLSLAAAS